MRPYDSADVLFPVTVGAYEQPAQLLGIGEVLPSAPLPFMRPWRVVAVGDLATIVESTIVDDLSRPSAVASDEWIRPGRAAWSSRLIAGDLDGRVVLARRRGTTWYVAGIHAASSPVELTFASGFLGEGTFELSIIGEGETSDSFERTARSIEAGAPLTLALRANGGFVGTLKPQ